MVREFLNYLIYLHLFRNHRVPTRNGSSSCQPCFARQAFFGTETYCLPLLLYCCAIWRQDSCPQRVKPSIGFELIHMVIYFKYPCISTSIFLEVQFVVPVASYFWWHNKIGQTIVLRVILAFIFKKRKKTHPHTHTHKNTTTTNPLLVQQHFWFECFIPALCNQPIIVSSVTGLRY